MMDIVDPESSRQGDPGVPSELKATRMSGTADPEAAIREKPLAPATLRELSARSNLQGALRTLSHYGAVVVTGGLIAVVSASHGLAWALPLMALQGYFVAFLFMAVHETAHKTAFESRTLNLVIGHLSAFIIMLSTPGMSLRYGTMPMLAVVDTRLPAMVQGSATTRPIFSARTLMSARLPTSACSTANSSPPKRDTRSVSRTQALSRSAMTRSSSSPIGWPRVSLTSLK